MENNHFEATIAKLTAVLDSLCDTYHQKVKDENYSGLSYVIKEICDVSNAITGLVEAEAKTSFSTRTEA